MGLVTQFKLQTVTLLELKAITPPMLNYVLELDQLCFGGLWTLEGYQRELDSPNSVLLGLFSQKTLLATSLDSTPLLGLGCFWMILDEAHITLLAVHPDYQRQGLGQALFLALLQFASDRGMERATLEVRASNESALSLYHKFGFKTAGRRRHYYKDTNEDALILWRGGLQYPEFQTTLATWQKSIGDRLNAAGWELQILYTTST